MGLGEDKPLQYGNLVKWVNGRMAGHWFLSGCTKPEAIGEEVKTQAVAFAKRIIEGDKK